MSDIKSIIRSIIVEMINEGGNVFDGIVSTVPKEHLEPTLERAMKDCGLKKVEHHLIGNIYKPYLGDVDVAIDFKDLVNHFNSNGEQADFWSKAEEYFSKQRVKDYAINKGLKQIHILTPLLDKSGKQQPAYDREGNQVGKLGFVQIDLMIGNAKFMKVSMAGVQNSEYKAAHRIIFIADILSQSEKEADGAVNHKFQFDAKGGLQYVRFKQVGNKREKLNIKTVSKDMDEIAAYIFGPHYKNKDIDTFEKMWSAFNSPTFRWKNRRKQIVDNYKRSLKVQKLPIPKEIE